MKNSSIKWNNSVSKTRKRYSYHLIGRCLILMICILLYFFYPQSYNVLNDYHFFMQFSPLHLLWFIWIIDMLFQLIPINNTIALGSRKLFKKYFKPTKDTIEDKALHHYILSATKSAYIVFILWVILISIIGLLYDKGFFNKTELFLISVVFYVCDLICVVIWCPFKFIMKNKCCTTCRIFNWDHLMMVSPLIFIGGFFSTSLIVVALCVWLLWEISVILYPERFWEKTNVALKCSECTDKLCTQKNKKRHLKNER